MKPALFYNNLTASKRFILAVLSFKLVSKMMMTFCYTEDSTKYFFSVSKTLKKVLAHTFITETLAFGSF